MIINYSNEVRTTYQEAYLKGKISLRKYFFYLIEIIRLVCLILLNLDYT